MSSQYTLGKYLNKINRVEIHLIKKLNKTQMNKMTTKQNNK